MEGFGPFFYQKTKKKIEYCKLKWQYLIIGCVSDTDAQ